MDVTKMISYEKKTLITLMPIRFLKTDTFPIVLVEGHAIWSTDWYVTLFLPPNALVELGINILGHGLQHAMLGYNKTTIKTEY